VLLKSRRAFTILRIKTDADTGAGEHLMTVDRTGYPERVEHALRGLRRPCRIGALLQEQSEFVPANPSQHFAGRNRATQADRDLLQK
jgi:hypothetical protein